MGGTWGHQGSAVGRAVHGGPCGSKLGPPALSPRALGPPALPPVPLAGPRGEETGTGPGWGRAVPRPFLRPRMQILHKHGLSHVERGQRMSQGEGDGDPERRFWYQPLTGTHWFGHPWVWYPPGGIAGAQVAPTSVTVLGFSFNFFACCLFSQNISRAEEQQLHPRHGQTPSEHPGKPELGE